MHCFYILCAITPTQREAEKDHKIWPFKKNADGMSQHDDILAMFW